MRTVDAVMFLVFIPGKHTSLLFGSVALVVWRRVEKQQLLSGRKIITCGPTAFRLLFFDHKTPWQEDVFWLIEWVFSVVAYSIWTGQKEGYSPT